jgi:DNA-binding response OmpR family regulator
MVGKRERVLLAEGDEQALEMLDTCLTADGFVVLRATDALGAVESFQKDAPDVLVLDAGLPGIDDGVSQAARSAGVPVILLVDDHRRVAEAFQGLDIDMCETVSRPFRARDLSGRIRTVLLHARIERSKRYRG